MKARTMNLNPGGSSKKTTNHSKVTFIIRDFKQTAEIDFNKTKSNDYYSFDEPTSETSIDCYPYYGWLSN